MRLQGTKPLTERRGKVRVRTVTLSCRQQRLKKGPTRTVLPYRTLLNFSEPRSPEDCSSELGLCAGGRGSNTDAAYHDFVQEDLSGKPSLQWPEVELHRLQTAAFRSRRTGTRALSPLYGGIAELCRRQSPKRNVQEGVMWRRSGD